MLIGFKAQFREPILDGSKLTTIRAERKDGWRPASGDKLYLYVGLRTKKAKKIAEALAVSVENFDITYQGLFLADRTLLPAGVEQVAREDGLKSGIELYNFLTSEHGFPFHGFITRWQWPLLWAVER